MGTKPGFYDELVAAARCRVDAAPKDKNAALDVIQQSAVALRDLLRHGVKPDPERAVYLAALLEALERIEAGADATTALHLKQSHRVRDENQFFRDLALWRRVGKELDRLTLERGHTRQDKPVHAALESVANAQKLSVPTVRKAWGRFGSAEGWEAQKADWI